MILIVLAMVVLVAIIAIAIIGALLLALGMGGDDRSGRIGAAILIIIIAGLIISVIVLYH